MLSSGLLSPITSHLNGSLVHAAPEDQRNLVRHVTTRISAAFSSYFPCISKELVEKCARIYIDTGAEDRPQFDSSTIEIDGEEEFVVIEEKETASLRSEDLMVEGVNYQHIRVADWLNDLATYFPQEKERVVDRAVSKICAYLSENSLNITLCCIGSSFLGFLPAALVLSGGLTHLARKLTHIFQEVIGNEVTMIAARELSLISELFKYEGSSPRTWQEVQKNYRKIALQLHPDKTNPIENHKKLQSINNSYDRFQELWRKGYRVL